MRLIAVSYWAQPVKFDPDTMCEHCNYRHATQYLTSGYLEQYRMEVCETCLQELITDLQNLHKPTWRLLED